MVMRSSLDPRVHRDVRNNPNTVLVDEMIGVAYGAVKLVAANIKYVKSVAYHMEYISILESHLANIKIVAESINYVDAIGENIDKLIVIHDELDMLNVVYDNMATIVSVGSVVPEIKILGLNIAAVQTNAQNIESIKTVAANIDKIVEAYDGSLEAARQAKASAAEAKTSETNSKESEGKAKNEADRAKTIADGVQTSVTAGLAEIKTAKDAGVSEINTTKTTGLSEMSTAKTGHVKNINDAGVAQTKAVNDAGTAQTSAVTGAGTTALSDIGTAKSDAVTAVKSQQTTSVNAVNSAGSGSLTAINNRHTEVITDINQKGSAAVTAIGTARSTALTDIGREVIKAENFAKASSDSADDSEAFAQQAAAVFLKMKGGTVGYILIKNSNADYDYTWAPLPGGGDMLKSVYDPNGMGLDVYSMGSMVETADAKILTSAERTKIGNISTVGMSGKFTDLTDIPATFTPSAHTHPITEVSGLPDKLATLVTGPISATSAMVVEFDGATGKLIKSSGYTTTALRARANHTGTQKQDTIEGLVDILASKESTADVDAKLALKASLAVASTTANGLMTSAHFTKLNGVQAGAQVNPDMNLYQTVALKGIAGGYAGLDSSGKVPTAQLPDVLFGSVQYQGSWNAATNTPAIPVASAANKGWYYMVSETGSTPINGQTEWIVGDWLVSNGSRWDRIKNTDAVTRVAGLRGDITVSALQTALLLKSAAYQDVGAFAAAIHGHSDATTTTAGFMSAADKVKLNASTSNTGTVTSVGISVPTGFTSGAAITTSGTIAITYASGFKGFTIAESNKLTGIADGANKTPALAAVATSGKYTDLTNIPTSFAPSAHTHTKDQVGLGNVDNTSDVSKPVSTTQQTALDLKLDKTGQAADSAKLGTETAAQWQAKIDAAGNWPGVYSGTLVNEVDFPIGHTVTVAVATNRAVARNGTYTVYFYTNGSAASTNSYSVNAPSGSQGPLALTGVWRSRSGATDSSRTETAWIEFERVA